MTDKISKAEYPLNFLGMGYRETLESGPYLFTDVKYVDEPENRRGRYCGACAFFGDNRACVALNRGGVDLMGSCDLYIDMGVELDMRHMAMDLKRNASMAESATLNAGDDLRIVQRIDKYIKEIDGKFCIISHRTGKNLGCSDTREEAEARLARMKRFRKDYVVKIAAVEEEKKIVYSVVLEPDEVDFHGDTVSVDEIEEAAHGYAMSPMVVGEGHLREAKARPVETFIHNPEVVKDVKPGSWVMAVKINDDALWEMVKNGELTGFSIGATARRVAVEEE